MVETLAIYVAGHGHTLAPSDVEFVSESITDTPGGEIMLLGGALFLSRDPAGGLLLDNGVDASDPSVGIFGASEPAGDPRPMLLPAIASACVQVIEQMRQDSDAEF